MAQQNANPLKTLVISMGVLLIGGTVLLFALVVKKVSAEAAKARAAQECAGGKVDLSGHGKIISSAMDGHIMRITLRKPPGHNETVSVDICTGKVIGTLVVETDG